MLIEQNFELRGPGPPGRVCTHITSSVARVGGGGARAPPIGMSTKMQNGKKHYVFSTFENVLCTGVDQIVI